MCYANELKFRVSTLSYTNKIRHYVRTIARVQLTHCLLIDCKEDSATFHTISYSRSGYWTPWTCDKSHNPLFTQCSGLIVNLDIKCVHYGDVIMGAIASQITSLMIVYSTVYSDADQRYHQSSASLAFVRGIHRGPVNSPQKWLVTRKMFPFGDVIMVWFRRIVHQTFLRRFLLTWIHHDHRFAQLSAVVVSSMIR